MKTVGEIKPDFQVIESGDPRILMIADTSDWVYAESKNSFFSVKLPGSIKEITYSFKKHSINSLNSHNLGISCLKGDCTEEEYVELPDGIYTIKIISGYVGIDKERYYLKTDKIELELAKSITLIGFDFTDESFKKSKPFQKIRWLINVAKSWTKLGDFVKADRFFQEAVRVFNQQKCK